MNNAKRPNSLIDIIAQPLEITQNECNIIDIATHDRDLKVRDVLKIAEIAPVSSGLQFWNNKHVMYCYVYVRGHNPESFSLHYRTEELPS